MIRFVLNRCLVVLMMAATCVTVRSQDEPGDITLPPVIVRPPELIETTPTEPAPTQPNEAESNVAPVIIPPVEFDSQFDSEFSPSDLNPVELEPLQVAPAEPTPSQSTNPTVGNPSQTPRQTSQAAGFPPFFLGLNEQTFGDDSLGQNLGMFRDATSLFDAPAAASIRSRQEIETRQAPDMFHALQNEVGVLMQSTAAGQASPFVRGLTGQQVLILVDGIRLNNSVTRRGPNQYFNTIDPGMVEQIEVLRGQGSVLWGADAIGGAINVVTRSAELHDPCCDGYASREFTQYYNTANSSPYSRMNVEGWVGQMGLFGGGSFLNVRDLDTGFDQFGRQPGTNYQQWAGDLKLNYLLSRDSMLTVAMQHFQQDDLPRSDRFPGYPLDRNNSNTFGGARFFDPQQRDLTYLRYQTLRPLVGLFDAATATASYHRQKERQTRGVPTTRFQEIDVDTVGLNWVGSKKLGQYGSLVTGADWYYDDIDSPFGGTASGPIVPDDAWYRRAGWFANWNVPLTQRLDAVLGTRYESIETAGTPLIGGVPVRVDQSYSDWIASVGLTYRVNRNVRIVGSIAEGFRPPNLDDLMANNPNVLQAGQSLPSLGLIPETSITYEIGMKINSDRLRAQAFVYWIDLEDNLVSITAAPNTFATANQDSTLQGVEADGEYLLGRNYSLYANYWYTYGTNDVTDAPLSRIPPMQGILGLRYRDVAKRQDASLYTWMSDRQDRLDPVRDVTDERIPIGGTPGFATLNLRLGRRFGCDGRHRGSISFENITDKAYLVHGSGVLGTGFTTRLGWTSSF